MMSQPFAFPPPPPPPAKRDSSFDQNTHPFQHSQRGGTRGRGNFRGAQRGSNLRGRGRGNSSSSSGSGGVDSRHIYTSGNAARYHNPSQQQPPRYHNVRPNSSGDTLAVTSKRTHQTAFGAKPAPVKRPNAPPAVPSFNIDIDSLLSKTQAPDEPPIKKTPARKNNVLGLTPSNQLSDSESEEDDDEARCAHMSTVHGLTFSHNGQTLSLRTPEEIATWIAERKRKYPTNAKIEAAKKAALEKKQAWERQKKEREEASRLKREERMQQRQEHEKQKIKQKLLAKVTAQAKAAIATQKDDGSQPALAKADKLRKEVEKATRRLKEAEDALRRMNDTRVATPGDASDTATQSVFHPDSEDASKAASGARMRAESDAKTSIDASDDVSSASESDNELEDTSSSGSSDDDANSGIDSGPEEISFKRGNPERVPPLQPTNDSETPTLCRNYVKYGRCKYGRRCHYSHKIPRKENDARSKNKPEPGRRKGLYQIMVEKEEEEEQKRALSAIIALGERGLLRADADVQ